MAGIDVRDWSLKKLVTEKEIIADEISSRLSVEQTIGCDSGYRADTRWKQAQLTQVLKEIDARHDELHDVQANGFEYIENILDRETDKAVLGDDGQIMVERFKTGIEPFDEHLINGGFAYGSLAAIAGESNSGKSDVVYMMIRSALQQELKIHLHSYELGYSSLFRNFGTTQKNKLSTDFNDPKYHKLLSIDQLAKESSDLKRMIHIRADDGCRVFILDSLTKITVNGRMVLDKEVIDVVEMLRELAHTRGLIIILVGQKDKQSKINNDFEMYGSVMQMHIFDYMFFIGYEDIDNKITTEREIVMVKNRDGDTKKSIITKYDADTHSIFYLRDSDGLGGGFEKESAWSARLK